VERYNSDRTIENDKDLKINDRICQSMGNVSFNWLYMSPVLEKMITYDKLFDGSITLFDIMTMNEAIKYKNDFEKNIKDYWEQYNGK
jgi:predicted small secreted protein